MASRQLVSLFLFSSALLSLELSFTKFFSVLLWYHFGFLIVSSAMLGFAAAGVLLTLMGERRERLSFFALINASAVSVLVCYTLLTKLDVAPATNTPTLTTVLLLAVLVLLLFVPFLFMGLTVSWIISTQRSRVGVVYGANLLGSGVGASSEKKILPSASRPSSSRGLQASFGLRLAVIVGINLGFGWVFGAASVAYLFAAMLVARKGMGFSAV